MASPHHRHQASLEGVIDLHSPPPLTANERAKARATFYQIVSRVEANTARNGPYNRPALVRLTYEYARSEESKDNVLRAFFQAAALPLEQEDLALDTNSQLDEELRDVVLQFADHLVDNFFLPLKASTKKTPQPSPATHSAVARIQGGQEFAGTPDRLSALRGACLVRDRHRCVISRKFDRAEAEARLTRDGENARDDNGKLIKEVKEGFEILEVAHILPHSLTQLDANKQLNPAKQTALSILNMFDAGVTHLIEGSEIDRPRNAITLSRSLHEDFGEFRAYFESTGEPNTYRIDCNRYAIVRNPIYPVSRTLFVTETHTIDPPSPRLLAVHWAIAQILHFSAAGVYIDTVLRDMELLAAKADGTSDLGRMVGLRLGGWLGAVGAS